MPHTTASPVTLRGRASSIVPLLVLGMVAAFWIREGVTNLDTPPDTVMHRHFLTLQAALIAGVFLAVSGYHRRQRVVMVVGMLAAIAVLAFELVFAVPLSVYQCAEWVEAARAAGVTTF